jgi:hypothetical protein
MMRRMFIPTTVVAAVLVLTGVACSGDGDDDESSDGTTTTEEVTTTTEAEGSESTTTTSGDPDAMTTTSGGQAAPTAPTVCQDTQGWNTRPDSELTSVLSVDPIYQLRAGRHDCYDQLTFVLNGRSPVGFHAAYAEGSDVADDESSTPTAGSAALAVNIHAPNQGGFYDNTGHQPGVVFAASRDVLYPTSNPQGLRVIQEVVSGGEFESIATFAVGMDQRRPFAVRQDINRDGNRVVIVRVAH